MRILLHNYTGMGPGHPFVVQLGRFLAHKGHQVLLLYTGYFTAPDRALQKSATAPATFSIAPINIGQPLQKNSLVRRWLQDREYGRLLVREMAAFKPDVVISANTPLDAQWMVLKRTREVSARSIFWLQDVIGLATQKILTQKVFGLGKLVGQYYLNLERSIAQKSDHIIPITDDFVPLLTRWGISPEKIKVIPNWAPIEEIPVLPKDNPWANQFGLNDRFVFLYSGTLGMKHNPELILQLGLSISKNPDACIVVVSQGLGADWLRKKVLEHSLKNLYVFDYQAMEVFPSVLASGDVLLAILEMDAGVYSVPSKVLSYLCAQRPLLLAVPANNLAAKIVSQNKAGIVVSPDNLEGFVQAAKLLMTGRDLRDEFARYGRSYAEANFGIEQIAQNFESVFN